MIQAYPIGKDPACNDKTPKRFNVTIKSRPHAESLNRKKYGFAERQRLVMVGHRQRTHIEQTQEQHVIDMASASKNRQPSSQAVDRIAKSFNGSSDSLGNGEVSLTRLVQS
ncbi:hypothetical protein GCM10027564_01080 [Luteimonas notoginsengisoli]